VESWQWTIERIDTLVRMEADGHSFGQIAAHLGCSRSSAIGKHHRLMVARGHVPTPRQRTNDAPRKKRAPAAPAAPGPVGLMLPALAAPVQYSDPAVGILDLTGCKWAVERDEALVGSYAFCNGHKESGSPYCSRHKAQAVDTTAKIKRRSIGAIGLRFEKRAA
jgi:hypothetical protein